MQIRKFIGDNIQDAMEKAKKELGENAIILHTKKVKKGGIFGFFKKEKIEVLAALEKEEVQHKSINFKEKILDNNIKEEIPEINKAKEHAEKIKSDEYEAKLLDNEIQELKKMIVKLNNKVDINFSNEDHVKNKFKNYYNKLKTKGLSEELIEDILSQIESVDLDEKEFDMHIEKYLLDKFKIINSYNFEFTKKINIFVGATGVGKTTTLAKMASEEVLKADKKVGFLTLDTYRISAVEQLKTYGDILNSPVEVAYDLDDVDNSIDRLKNRDLIFVDTAGRSYKNKKQMEELKEFLNYFEEKDVFLTLSANWDTNDIKDILETYRFLDEYKIIVTKLDETNRIGVILDILYRSNKIVTHTTFGQNVPDDIEKFDIKKLVNEVLRR